MIVGRLIELLSYPSILRLESVAALALLLLLLALGLHSLSAILIIQVVFIIRAALI